MVDKPSFFDQLAMALHGAFSSTSHGATPMTDDQYLVTEYKNIRGLKWKLTRRINQIRQLHPGRNFKFGKTGQGISRAQWDDYIHAAYGKMYFLFESHDPRMVSIMEKHYIDKHDLDELNDNERNTDADNMSHNDKRYHIYMVI